MRCVNLEEQEREREDWAPNRERESEEGNEAARGKEGNQVDRRGKGVVDEGQGWERFRKTRKEGMRLEGKA